MPTNSDDDVSRTAPVGAFSATNDDIQNHSTIDEEVSSSNIHDISNLIKSQGEETAKPTTTSQNVERRTLSRRTTRDSVPRSASYQRPTPQLLSSLMADSSTDDDDEDGQSSDSKDFDLYPPALKPQPPSVETLSELLFSSGHLRSLLQHSTFLARFTSFMHRYQPKDYPLLVQYVESSKAIAAIEYANAIAASTSALNGRQGAPLTIAKLDNSFEESHNAAFKSILTDALPLYITYSLIRVVSECLENEITGKISPIAKNLVGGLSEVFCITDPNQDDNPIVFASQEFYRFTGYDRDQVIGHNCRFLQGARTRRESPARIKACLDQGDEIHETLLNYRRDGRPFMNLLMLAPLYDNAGRVKYHIGAQVDVTGLVEGGRAVESFQQFLAQRDIEQQKAGWADSGPSEAVHLQKQNVLDKLKGLSELLDREESAAIQSSSRHNSVEQSVEKLGLNISMGVHLNQTAAESSTSIEQDISTPPSRENSAWDIGKVGPHGPAGTLPGVYEKYMLIRPAPSLRIIFASSKLKAWGKMVQDPFMSHIATDQNTLAGLNECFKTGAPVTAKVKYLLQRSENRHGTTINTESTNEQVKQSRSCWISATPLFGSNDRVGVWMVVFVERMKGSDRDQRQGVFGRNISQPEMSEMNRRVLRRQSYHRALSSELPIKPKRLEGDELHMTQLNTAVQNLAVEHAKDHHEQKAERQRKSPSPTANQSRKASPRQQTVDKRSGSKPRRLSRRRLPSHSDGDESNTES